jgi:Bacterial toxin YdaS
MKQQQQLNPVLQLVRTKRGTASRIAEACGIVRHAVWNWRRVPAEHVLVVAALLKIPRHQIRPDIYPPPRNSNNGRRLHGARAS